MAETIRLTVLTGPHQGKKYCFRGAEPATLGRASDCHICLCGEARDLCISRHHCRVTLDSEGVRVEDLGSSNGTFVNGQIAQAAEAVAAKDGDFLTMGGTTLQIELMQCTGGLAANTVKTDCPVDC